MDTAFCLSVPYKSLKPRVKGQLFGLQPENATGAAPLRKKLPEYRKVIHLSRYFESSGHAE